MGRAVGAIAAVAAVAVAAAAAYVAVPGLVDGIDLAAPGPAEQQRGAPPADAYTGTVTKVVDGDTLDIDQRRIRLVLVDTPERGDAGFSEATAFTRGACPVGSAATYVVDSMQGEDRYGRIVAAVWCDGTGNATVNEALLDSGHARLYGSYCQRSSFGAEGWAVRHGC